ncbi:MAG: DUF4340 domain-containing protein [Planctomycetes bacterium]|nr:DUF4340 domain-containing protein [Planctomycetota bacterium]
MRPIHTVVHLALAFLLGTFLWLDYHEFTTTDERLRKEQKVFDVVADQVTELELVRGEETIALSRDASRDWRLVKPVEARADRGVLDAITNGLEGLERKHVLEGVLADARRLEEYGLATPRAVVRFGVGVRRQEFAVGKDTPVTSAGEVYLRVGESPDVVLVPNSLWTALDKKLDEFRDKKVVDVDKWGLTSFRVERAGRPAVAGTKGDASAWRLTEPVPCRADRWKVEDYLGVLCDLKAEAFQDDPAADLAALGLDAPAARARLLKDDKAILVDVGRDVPEQEHLWVKREGSATLFGVKKDLLAKLEKDPAELRDRHVERISSWSAQGLTIAAGGRTVRIEKDGADWKMKEPLEAAAEPKSVTDLLTALDGLEWKAVAAERAGDLAPYGLASPLATLTVVEGEGAERKEKAVLFGQPDPARSYAKLPTEDPVYEVPSTFLSTITEGPLRYLARKVFDFSADKAVAVSATAGTRSTSFTRPEGGPWTAAGEATVPADPEAVASIVSRLSGLTAESYEAEDAPTPADYGLDAPTLSVAVTLKAEAGPDGAAAGDLVRTLVVGRKSGERAYFARTADRPYVFALAESAVNELRDLVEKSVKSPQ